MKTVAQIACFAHAGSTAAHFVRWRAVAAARFVEVLPIELPGKGLRFSEPPLTDIRSMANEAASILERTLRLPFVLFGHSLGALVAFETARLLEARGRIPLYLVSAGAKAPHLYPTGARKHDLAEVELIQELRLLRGTPPELLDTREVIGPFLSAIRADFRAIEEYSFVSGPRLNCPIAAFGGMDDRQTTLNDIQAWHRNTIAAFTTMLFDGDHFFVQQTPTRVVEQVLALLPVSLWVHSPDEERSRGNS